MSRPALGMSRRAALAHALWWADWWSLPAHAQSAWAFQATAFDAKTLPDVLAAAGMGALEEASEAVTLLAPEAVDNGALVPMSFGSSRPDVKRLALVAPDNPTPLLALFEWTPRLMMPMALRVKLAKTGDVYAVVQLQDGRTLYVRQAVRVSVSGCD